MFTANALIRKSVQKKIVSYVFVLLGCFFTASVAAETYTFGSFGWSSSYTTEYYTDSDGSFTLSWPKVSPPSNGNYIWDIRLDIYMGQ